MQAMQQFSFQNANPVRNKHCKFVSVFTVALVLALSQNTSALGMDEDLGSSGGSATKEDQHVAIPAEDDPGSETGILIPPTPAEKEAEFRNTPIDCPIKPGAFGDVETVIIRGPGASTTSTTGSAAPPAMQPVAPGILPAHVSPGPAVGQPPPGVAYPPMQQAPAWQPIATPAYTAPPAYPAASPYAIAPPAPSFEPSRQPAWQSAPAPYYPPNIYPAIQPMPTLPPTVSIPPPQTAASPPATSATPAPAQPPADNNPLLQFAQQVLSPNKDQSGQANQPNPLLQFAQQIFSPNKPADGSQGPTPGQVVDHMLKLFQPPAQQQQQPPAN